MMSINLRDRHFRSLNTLLSFLILQGSLDLDFSISRKFESDNDNFCRLENGQMLILTRAITMKFNIVETTSDRDRL